MARDLNDARVSFTAAATKFGLTLDQSKHLWRLVMPPFPTLEALPVQTVRASNVSEEEKR